MRIHLYFTLGARLALLLGLSACQFRLHTSAFAAENAAHKYLLPAITRDRGANGPTNINGVLYYAVTDESLERDKKKLSAHPELGSPHVVSRTDPRVKEVNQFVRITRPTPILVDPREPSEVLIGSITPGRLPGQPPPVRETNQVSIGSTEIQSSRTHSPTVIRTTVEAPGVRVLRAPGPGIAIDHKR